MGVNNEHSWLAFIRSLIRAYLLIWSPPKAFCQGELPVMLQLETTFLLIFTAKILQLVLPAPAQLWACGMAFLCILYKHQGTLHSSDVIFAFADQTHRLSVPEAEEAALQRGHLQLQALALPPEI